MKPTDVEASEACRRLVASAERELGRQLTPEERAAVGRLEPFVAQEASSSGATEVATLLDSIAGRESIVTLMKALSASATSLAEDRAKIVHAFPQGSGPLSEFDWEHVLQAFSSWLLSLVRLEPPPKGTRALNFGLVESGGVCVLYVSGSKCYSARDEWFGYSTDRLGGQKTVVSWLAEGEAGPTGRVA